MNMSKMARAVLPLTSAGFAQTITAYGSHSRIIESSLHWPTIFKNLDAIDSILFCCVSSRHRILYDLVRR